MRQAVFKMVYTLESRVTVDLISPDVKPSQTKCRAGSIRLAHLPHLYAKLSPYLTGRPQAKASQAGRFRRTRMILPEGWHRCGSKYKGSSGNFKTRRAGQIHRSGAAGDWSGWAFFASMMTTDWATMPVDTQRVRATVSSADGPLVINEDGEFATRDNVLGTNVIVGSDGRSESGRCDRIMFYPEVVLTNLNNSDLCSPACARWL